ncbi:hypothetical protein O6H91_16G068200 [Diphasiastrum complanatum]|uniref:Uncharacterized protein n=1 Tax=Diphasiastrum complanatum TaxID=34168 RepID=A0ACC2BDA4_DIPCM|nr:hypothetical protein O6H91_Y113300 [Diphasiastrum complanatum]KAJ7527731.1 hypothetical protein O6H91_16G068200 [Diphasiastrum complanatum]
MGLGGGRFASLGQNFREKRKLVREMMQEAKEKSELCSKAVFELSDRMPDVAISITRERQGKVEELQAQLKNSKEQFYQRKTDLGSKQEQLGTLEELIIQEREKHHSLKKRVRQLIERRKLQQEIITDDMKDIDERVSYRKKKLEAKLEAVSWYNEVLAIRAEFSNAIKFVFSKIDPENPEREFTCSIRLDKNTNKYTLLECVPKVPKSDDLVYELNISNRFFEFVRIMRQEFLQLAVRSSSAYSKSSITEK